MRTRAFVPLLHSLPLVAVLVVAGSGALSGPSAQPAALPPPQSCCARSTRSWWRSTPPTPPATTRAAARGDGRRLLAAGFPAADVRCWSRAAQGQPRRAPARHRRAEPLLLLAHLDVVEAKREDWSVDPFKLLERDGYFYGRGTGDDKAMAAIFVANLIRYRREGFVPDRDLIVALTADEEGGGAQRRGVAPQHHRALIDAELAINEGGGGGAIERQACVQQRPGEREDRPELSARGEEQGRAQLAARQGQRDLPPRRRAGAARPTSTSRSSSTR